MSWQGGPVIEALLFGCVQQESSLAHSRLGRPLGADPTIAAQHPQEPGACPVHAPTTYRSKVVPQYTVPYMPPQYIVPWLSHNIPFHGCPIFVLLLRGRPKNMLNGGCTDCCTSTGIQVVGELFYFFYCLLSV